MNGHVALVSAGLSGILAGLCGAAVAASGPLGSELQINSYTTDDQIQSAVAVAPSGDFVVVWISPQDGEFKGVFAQRVAGSGAFQGVELQINGYTLGNQLAPSVATDADGDFIVAWASSQDGDLTGAFARRFDSAGSPVASELQINTYTTGSQTVPSIAASGNGAFVVAWQSQGQDGDDNGIFLRRFSSLGAALGGELQVNTYTTGTQNDPAIALRGGEFVVVWSDYDGHDGDGIGVFGQRFDFAIGPLGAEFQLSTRTAGSQVSPAVAMTGNGEFVVVWQSPGDAFFGTGIFGRRYDSSGAPLGLEFLVNGHTADSQFSPAVSSSGDGGFTVVWESNLTDGSFTGIFGRDFDSLGAPLAVEFQVNTYTQLGQHGAAIAMNGAGRFAVSWVSDEQDGDTYGVFARRFAPATATPTVTLTPTSTRTPTPTSTPTVTPTPSVTPTPLPLTLDVDGNGVASPLTDGLLVLRFQFSFTGATLVNGAVDLGGCTRCTATDIANYLSGLGLTLDIDGNGTAGALTDGLLVIRFLFGFTGTTLTNGVVGAGCSRCDASTIVPYLETLN